MDPVTENIVHALARENRRPAAPTAFHAEHTLDPHALEIEVEGVGSVSLPLTRRDVERLLKASSAARFGLRDKTLLDKTVRDTQEIAADKLRIRVDDKAMSSLLSAMCKTLGLPDNAVLVPHLHNMLIYGPEQFFKPHRDSEKIDGMVATLVVVLPSPHIGGDLLIRHGKGQHRFVSEHLDGDTLKCIAFYADCEHEIDKIRQGYRVALTYNLALEATAASSSAKAEHANPALERALREYFEQAPDRDGKPPKLVYFLDHRYTEHSLQWELLKGADRKNAGALRRAAERLELTPHLALAEIHEIWSTIEEYGGRYRRRYRDDEDDDYEDENEPELDELIEDSTSLSHWIDAAGKKLPYREVHVVEDEVCWSKETNEDDLTNSEHEGWMGNYGNTMDYWYRRAAIVLWREADRTAISFDLDFDRALAGLSAMTKKRGNETQVVEIVAQASAHLRRAAGQPGAGQFTNFTRIAIYLQNETIARDLLAGFSIADIDTDAARDLVDLQKVYGAAWCLALIKAWRDDGKQFRFRATSDDVNVDDMVRRLLSHGGDPAVAAFLVDAYIDRIAQADAYLEHATPVQQLAVLDKRIDALKRVLRAGIALHDDAVVKKIAAHVMSNPALYPAPELADLLLALHKQEKGAPLAAYAALLNDVAQRIRHELDQGLRKKGDWSIPALPPCKCAYCKTTVEFLASAAETERIWPIAQQHRDHVMRVFNGLGLPIRFEERKQGSPYKLVITKSERLYNDAKKRFERIEALDAQLRAASRARTK